MIELVDDFLPDDEFEALRDVVMGLGMHWYYTPNITTHNITDDRHFYMSHIFYNSNKYSDMFKFVTPLLNRVMPHGLIRIKANMYPNQGERVTHEAHFDYDFPHRAALFSINDCDGATVIGGEEFGSKANRIVFFDGSQLHSSTTCTDAPVRVNININYAEGEVGAQRG
tara:strand:+ start:21180 stop:21686 length:507 start_codon:yes stop_codon:yes gene_type:complete